MSRWLRGSIQKAGQVIPLPGDLLSLSACFKYLRHWGVLWSCLCWNWGKISPKRRRLLIHLLIGLGIVALLQGLHNAPAFIRAEDTAMDWTMRLWQGNPPSDPATRFISTSMS